MSCAFLDEGTEILTSARPVLHWAVFPKHFGDCYVIPSPCPAVCSLEPVLEFELHTPAPQQGGDKVTAVSNYPIREDRIHSVTFQGVSTRETWYLSFISTIYIWQLVP